MDDLENEDIDDLPEWASEENKNLHAEMRKKERDLATVTAALAEHKDRIGVMKEHLASVVAEQQRTQALVSAKVKEIETEDHLKQLAERERGRFSSELKKQQQEIADLTDKISSLQASIFKGNEQMDKFKLQMNWNQEELEQWALAARQKEEDNLALLKYTKADEAKMKELNLQLEKVLSAVTAKQAELEAEITETQAKQIELDKTADDFRALHQQRRELVGQWEQAVQAMQQRDDAIIRSQEEFAQMKAEIKAQQEQLAEKNAFLKTEEKNNAEVEMRIAMAERTIGKRREMQLNEASRLQELHDQLEAVRGTVAKAADEVNKRRAEVADLKNQAQNRKGRLERAKKQLLRAEKQAEMSKENMGDLERSAKQLEEVQNQEKARLKAIEKDSAAIKDQMFAESQKLFEAKQEEANLVAEISGAQRESRNATQRIKQLDDEAQRQKELVYTADFQLQLMERKVARASGVRTVQEQVELKKRIAELTAQLDQQNSTFAMLSAQSKRLANDLKRAKRQAEELTADQKRIKSAIDEVEMSNDLASKQLKKLTAQKEESLMSADVLKLEVKRLREKLNAKADEVFGLENRKFQLQMSMDERQQEIKVHSEVLKAQHKAAEDERHLAARQKTDRLRKVEKLSNKYDIICGKLGGADGEDNTGEHSQAYYVIKAAQEREELQRQGDELDQQIQKAEREVRALEKTLAHLFAKNAGYKQSFAPADTKTPAYEQKLAVEEQHRVALSKYRTFRLQHAELEEEIGQLDATAAEIEEDKQRYQAQLMNSAEESSRMNVEIDNQKDALEQAKAQVRALLSEHRQTAEAAGVSGKTLIELETAVVEQKAANQIKLEKLALAVEVEEEASEALLRACAEAGVPPPGTLDDEYDEF